MKPPRPKPIKEVEVCGQLISKRLAMGLNLVGRVSGLIDSMSDPDDYTQVTERVLRGLPMRMGRRDMHSYRGIGLGLLKQIEAFLGRFGLKLVETIPQSQRRSQWATGYLEGPPGSYGHYWWVADESAPPEMREVTEQDDPASLVAGWWAGPLQPPAFQRFRMPGQPGYGPGGAE